MQSQSKQLLAIWYDSSLFAEALCRETEVGQSEICTNELVEIARDVESHGFSVINRHQLLDLRDDSPDFGHLERIRASFGELGKDPSPGSRFRAFKRFQLIQNHLMPDEDASYLQSKIYNDLDGGKVRTFEPISPSFLSNPLLEQLLATDIEIARQTSLFTGKRVEVGLHQIRYLALPGSASFSSPVWLHKDDEPLVFVHLFGISSNACGGDNLISSNGRLVDVSLRLQQPLDTMLLGKAVFHAVTPLGTLDDKPASRDVLLVTFKSSNIVEM